MAQIICRDAALGYEGRAVVQHLNFQVDRGDYLCIVGENGSGKSTLVKALLKLKEPMAGEICLGDGLEADGIGYLPQQTIVQKDFPASVQEIVLSGCLGRFGFRPFYGRKEKETAARQMERLGITHLAGRCYRELSGGRECCWPGLCAPPGICCFWMSRWRGLIRWRSRRCTVWWRS